MKSIIALLRQQATGIINLSLPILAVAYFYQEFIQSIYGIIICSLGIGLHIWQLNRTNTLRQIQMLQHVPSGTHKDTLESIITSCNVNPETVQLHYGYTYQAIAMALNNVIIIDPLICSLFEDAPEAGTIKGIIDTHITPTMPQDQKNRIHAIKQVLSDKAQLFIIKHELGHVVHNYSQKKLILIGFIGAFAAYTGIMTSIVLLPTLGTFAIFAGLLAAGIVDLVVSYSSNYFFKGREEKNADLFAAQYSTREEILAAATFFELHQDIINRYREDNLVSKIPGIILSGHPDGKTRSNYLRKLSY